MKKVNLSRTEVTTGMSSPPESSFSRPDSGTGDEFLHRSLSSGRERKRTSMLLPSTSNDILDPFMRLTSSSLLSSLGFIAFVHPGFHDVNPQRSGQGGVETPTGKILVLLLSERHDCVPISTKSNISIPAALIQHQLQWQLTSLLFAL